VRQAAVAAPLPAPVTVPQPAPVAYAAPQPAPVAYGAPIEPTPQVAQAAPRVEPPFEVATAVKEALAPIADALRPAPRKVAAKAPRKAPRPALSPAAARLTQSLAELRRNASLRTGASRSRSVVQLGAFDSRAYIASAWSRAVSRHAALRYYTPVTARFASAKGTFYRLSVKGFGSDREAIVLCNQLKRVGANCFVRAAHNDVPVQLASR
jgi:hypothetical protein